MLVSVPEYLIEVKEEHFVVNPYDFQNCYNPTNFHEFCPNFFSLNVLEVIWNPFLLAAF